MEDFENILLEFHNLNESVLEFLNEEEKDADQEYWFKPKRDSFLGFVKTTEEWFRNARLRMRISQECDQQVTQYDSISVVALQQGSARLANGNECAVSMHSTGSRASSAHLKEAANKAAIEAKVAALKEKQALELKEIQLKAEKEELMLRTALAESTAKMKVYEGFEGLQGASYRSQTSRVRSQTMYAKAVKEEDEWNHTSSHGKHRHSQLDEINVLGARSKSRKQTTSAPANDLLYPADDGNDLRRMMQRQADITKLLIKNQQVSALYVLREEPHSRRMPSFQRKAT